MFRECLHNDRALIRPPRRSVRLGPLPIRVSCVGKGCFAVPTADWAYWALGTHY